MTLLVTGATGFVGRNFVARAAARGDHILAPVRDAAKLGRILAADGIPDGAVRPLPANPAAWPDPLPADGIVHCAGALFEDRLETYLQTNVDWTLAVLSRLPRGCPAVVLSSQSAGGPTPKGREARSEADADDPISGYGESKLRMERAIPRRFPEAAIAILRPPMILGPRDAAALQLFRAAKSPLRPKPGLRAKAFSFVDVADLVEAIWLALAKAGRLGNRPWYVAARQTFTDLALIRGVGAAMGTPGFAVPLPHVLVRAVAAVVARLPGARKALPSLGPDRVREIFADRWVVDAAAFESATGWEARTSLAASLASCRDYYAATGMI